MSVSPLLATITSLSLFPESIRNRLIAKDLARRIPFIDGMGFIYHEIRPERVVIRLPNSVGLEGRGRACNAYQVIHPVAIALLAETAAGFLVGMNQSPEDRYDLRKMDTAFFYSPEVSAGDLIATISADDNLRQQIKVARSAEINLSVQIVAETQRDIVCKCHTTWSCWPGHAS